MALHTDFGVGMPNFPNRLNENFEKLEFIDNVTYYVSPTGNDQTGDGSIERPFKTIKYATRRVKECQYHYRADIILMPGQYVESVTLCNLNHLVIRSYNENPNTTVVKSVNPEGAFVFLGCDGLNVKNIGMENFTDPAPDHVLAVVWSVGGSVTLEGCSIKSKGIHYGVLASMGDMYVRESTISNTTHAIVSHYSASTTSYHCNGSNNRYGLAAWTATIHVEGTIPDADIKYLTNPGGHIFAPDYQN